MNVMKITLFLLVIIFSPAFLYSQTENLRATITLNKSEYLEGEEVWVSVTIRNVGSKPDSLFNLSEEYILRDIGVINGKGKAAEYKGMISEPRRPHYTIFMQGDSIGYSEPIQSDYGNEKEKSNEKFAGGNFFTEDEYYVKFWGNSVKFVVKKPTGYESDARKELMSLYNANTPRTEIDKKLKTYRDFAFRNIKSVYAERAFYDYCAGKVLSGEQILLLDEEFIGDCQWFKDNFPNSYYSGEIIWDEAYSIAKVRNNKYMVKNFLEGIIENHPNTIASWNANYYLTYDFINSP